MEITETSVGQATLLRVAGRVDGTVSKALEDRLTGAVAEPRQLVLDLSELAYISSAGLRALLVAAKSAKRTGATLVLAGLTANVRDVFDMSGFTALFRIYETPEEALAAGD